MIQLKILIIVTAICLTVANCQVQLPCYSSLHQYDHMARFFEHCICRYDPWTEMTPLPNATSFAVPFSQCKSELAILSERRQLAISGEECNKTVCRPCQHRQEEGFLCISTCRYSDWTNVVANTSAAHIHVPEYQCKSGYALPGERWKLALGGYVCNGTACEICQDIEEERYVCEPTMTERLILSLELGTAGQDYNSVPNCSHCGFRTKRHDDPLAGVCPDHESICSSKQVCHTDEYYYHYYRYRYAYRGRRSESKMMETETSIQKIHRNPPLEPKPLPIDPIPFHLIEHRARYRRQRNVQCEPDGTRYVLFVIDTSSSIGSEHFTNLTSTLSTLVGYFCKRIKIAVLTFSDEHYVEFCFDCFDNDCAGRASASDMMSAIRYRKGVTHTGTATQCVCDFVLTPKCGFPILTGERTTCLDVVYVTDGMSNGPENVCKEVQCLYDLRCMGVELNVFAFGINVYDPAELRCITRDRSVNYVNNAVYEVDSFSHFADVINSIGPTFEDISSSSGSGDELDIMAPDCFAIDATDGISFDDCDSP